MTEQQHDGPPGDAPSPGGPLPPDVREQTARGCMSRNRSVLIRWLECAVCHWSSPPLPDDDEPPSLFDQQEREHSAQDCARWQADPRLAHRQRLDRLRAAGAGDHGLL